MADDVIKSFLVSLNYKVDKGSEKDFERSIQAATKNAMAFAAAAAAMAAAAVAAVDKVARSFDDLYFASRRTGASVENLKSLSYAFSQIGGSADGGKAAIEGFAKALRTNPGTKTLLHDLGVATESGGKVRDTVAVLMDLQKAFASRPHYINAQYGSILGLDEETVRLLETGQLAGRMREYEETARKIGLNHAEAARNGFEFERALGSLKMTLTVISEKFLTEFEPALTKFFNATREWVLENYPAFEKAMSGIAERFDAVSKALSSEEGFLGRLSKASDAFMKIVEAIKALDQAFNLPNISKLWSAIGDFDHATSIGNINTGAGNVDAEGKGIFRRGLDGIKGAATSMWNRATGGGSSSSGPSTPITNSTALKDLITSKESGGKDPYNVVYGNGKYGQPPKPITQMTIGEILAWQHEMRAKVGSPAFPVGRMQVVESTLRAQAKKLGLDHGTVFSPAVQEKVFDSLIAETGGDPARLQATWDGLRGVSHAAIIAARDKGRTNSAKPPISLGAFGGGAPAIGWGNSLQSSGLTAPGAMSNNNVHMVHSTTIHIDGSGDPSEVANKIAGSQDRISSRMLRNAQGAIR